jgi:NTP pyrophosphatase (non-canonical NTP hydrolase)
MNLAQQEFCEDAIKKFGADKQKDKCIEECAELIDALIKNRNGRCSDDDVISEIADVRIVVEQMTIIYGRVKVNKEINFKLQRLLSRIYSQCSSEETSTETKK